MPLYLSVLYFLPSALSLSFFSAFSFFSYRSFFLPFQSMHSVAMFWIFIVKFTEKRRSFRAFLTIQTYYVLCMINLPFIVPGSTLSVEYSFEIVRLQILIRDRIVAITRTDIPCTLFIILFSALEYDLQNVCYKIERNEGCKYL